MSSTVGHVVTVTLQTSGYGRFEDPAISQPIVQMIDSSSPPRTGEGVLFQVYRFAVLAPGATEIRFHHTASTRDTVVELTIAP